MCSDRAECVKPLFGNQTTHERKIRIMTTLNVPISDDTLLRLKELAAEHVARQPAGDFDEIAARILAKNTELYRRLAE